MSHKYRLRELVRFVGVSRFDTRQLGEVYEVIRLLPADASGEPTYRIKTSGTERAVRECEITALH